MSYEESDLDESYLRTKIQNIDYSILQMERAISDLSDQILFKKYEKRELENLLKNNKI